MKINTTAISPRLTDPVHIYIYFVRNGRIFYERTTSCEIHAKSRCEEIRKWKDVDDAIYSVGTIIKGAFV